VNTVHSTPQIDRHKAAIVRNDLSRPVRLALEAGLFAGVETFFDYGCGHGLDVRLLAERGVVSNGWDPYYLPDGERQPAEIVNLGYVINVIEHEPERREALRNAWALTGKALIVAAQVLIGKPGKGHYAYNDGLITSRNTFQKYYEQQELKNFIDTVLGVDAVPAGLGVYFAFRDEAAAQTFRASRFRSRAVAPKISTSIKNFDAYRELLQPLMDFVGDRGRLPIDSELINEDAVRREFRSISKAFAVIVSATSAAEWESIKEKRRQDFLVYLALSKFGKRPSLTLLPSTIRQDIKSFFGSYAQACAMADDLLFSLGKPEVINEACRKSHIGKFVGNALYVHISALEQLSPVLRLYEGCASRTFGLLEEATLIKFRADKPKISYLHYPDFDTDPHPALKLSMQADLQGIYAGYRDYSTTANPPILHRKETFVAADYPLYPKFARLTAQEEKWGLLEEANSIGTRGGWLKRLATCGAKLRGHRLVRQKPTRLEEDID